MSLSPRRSAKVAPGGGSDGAAAAGNEGEKTAVAAESHDDDSADDASTSLQKIQSGPRFSQGQVLKCILPVLSEDLTQLCRVEGFDQRKLCHDVRRLHDDGKPYDSKRTTAIDLAVVAHAPDVLRPLRQHQSWIMQNYGEGPVAQGSGNRRQQQDEPPAALYLRELVWEKPQLNAGVYWVCQITAETKEKPLRAAFAENLIFKEACKVAAVEREDKMAMWRAENPPPGKSADEQTLKRYAVKLREQQAVRQRDEVATRNKWFRGNVPADAQLAVDLVVEATDPATAATHDTPVAIVRFPSLSTRVVTDYGERGEKVRMGKVEVTVEFLTDRTPAMLKQEKKAYAFQEGEDVEVLEQGTQTKAWLPRRVKKVNNKDKTISVEGYEKNRTRDALTVPREDVRRRIDTFRYPVPAVWSGDWEDGEVRKEREAKLLEEKRKEEERARQERLKNEMYAIQVAEREAAKRAAEEAKRVEEMEDQEGGEKEEEEGGEGEEGDADADSDATVALVIKPPKWNLSTGNNDEHDGAAPPADPAKDQPKECCSFDAASGRWLTYWSPPVPPRLRLRLQKGTAKSTSPKGQLWSVFLDSEVLPAVLEMIKFKWLGGTPIFAYQRGARIRNIRLPKVVGGGGGGGGGGSDDESGSNHNSTKKKTKKKKKKEEEEEEEEKFHEYHGVSGTIVKKDRMGWYAIRVDNTTSSSKPQPDFVTIDPNEKNHRPGAEVTFERGTWLTIDRGEEGGGWVDAKVLEYFHGKYSLHADDNEGDEHHHHINDDVAIDFDTNDVNHAVCRLAHEDYVAALREYLVQFEREEALVTDALTGCVVNIKDQTVEVELSADSKSDDLFTDDGDSGAHSIDDLAKVMTELPGEARQRGVVKSHFVVLRSPPGGGKTWAAKKFMSAVVEGFTLRNGAAQEEKGEEERGESGAERIEVREAGEDGEEEAGEATGDSISCIPLPDASRYVPMLIKVCELASLGTRPLVDLENTDVVHWFCQQKYGTNQPHVCAMLLQAFYSRRLVLVLDGADEDANLKSPLVRFVAEELARLDGLRLLVTLQPDAVDRDLLNAHPALAVLRLKPLSTPRRLAYMRATIRGLPAPALAFFSNLFRLQEEQEQAKKKVKEVQEVKEEPPPLPPPQQLQQGGGAAIFPMEYFRHIYSHEVAAVLASHIIPAEDFDVNGQDDEAENEDGKDGYGDDDFFVLIGEAGLDPEEHYAILVDLAGGRRFAELEALDVQTIKRAGVPLKKAKLLLKATRARREELDEKRRRAQAETAEEKAERERAAEARAAADTGAAFLRAAAAQKARHDQSAKEQIVAEEGLRRRLRLLLRFLEDPISLTMLIVNAIHASEGVAAAENPAAASEEGKGISRVSGVRFEAAMQLPKSRIHLYEQGVARLLGRAVRGGNLSAEEEHEVMRLLKKVAFWNHEHQNRTFSLDDVDGGGSTSQSSAHWLRLSEGGILPLAKVIVAPVAAGPLSMTRGMYRFLHPTIQCYLGSMRLLERLQQRRDNPHAPGAAMWDPLAEESVTAVLMDGFYDESVSMLSEVAEAPGLLFPTASYASTECDQEGFERLLRLHGLFPALQQLDLTHNAHIHAIPEQRLWRGGAALLELHIGKGCGALRGTLAPMIAATSLQKLVITDCKGIGGKATPPVVSWLSTIAEKNIKRCGRFTLAENLSVSIGQVAAVDLSGIDTLVGDFSDMCRLSAVKALRLTECAAFSCCLEPAAVEWLSAVGGSKDLEHCGRLTLAEDLSSVSKDLSVFDLSTCTSLETTLEPLRSLTSLTELRMQRCARLSGSLEFISDLTSLVVLDLGCCKLLQGPMKPIAAMLHLETLNLTFCDGLSGQIDVLGNLTRLSSLDLHGCAGIRGSLQPLSSHAALRRVDLSGLVHLTGDLRPLSQLTNLAALHLQGCRLLSGGLEPLAALEKLETLNMMRCTDIAGGVPGVVIKLLSRRSANLLYCKGPFSIAPGLTGLGGSACSKLDFTSLGSKLRGSLEPLAHLGGAVTHIDFRRCTKINVRAELFPGVTIIADEENGDERFADRRGSGRRVAESTEKIQEEISGRGTGIFKKKKKKKQQQQQQPQPEPEEEVEEVDAPFSLKTTTLM